MAVPDGPLRSTVDQDPLDDEWERFQANGCPDWWLLAKYVGQAARNIPYQPFRSMSVGGGLDSRRSMELQQQQQQQGDGEEHAAARRPVASDATPSTAAGSAHQAGPDAHSSLCSPSSSVPDALPTSVSRGHGGLTAPPAAATAAAAAGAAAPACGLKGLFGCTGGCTPPCTASQPADQAV